MASEKLSPSARKSLNESCQTMEKGIDKLKAEIDQGDYTIALNAAMTTMRQVYEIENEIEKASK